MTDALLRDGEGDSATARGALVDASSRARPLPALHVRLLRLGGVSVQPNTEAAPARRASVDRMTHHVQSLAADRAAALAWLMEGEDEG